MPRRVMTGKVVSDKMDKTVTVLVERRLMHPVYKKFIRQSKRFLAHDEDNLCRIDDRVSIMEAPPRSRRKRWVVLPETLQRGRRSELEAAAKEAAPAAPAAPAPTAAPATAADAETPAQDA